VLRAGNPVDRTLPVVLSILAYLVLNAGAYVGGEVVYVLGNMVSRHAFRGGGTKWTPLELEGGGTLGDLVAGQPVKGKLGINNLVVVRDGDNVYALHETCAHAGGPLAQGTIVDGCIQCPWHASRFRLDDGSVERGPAAYPQPVFEVRERDGRVEVRFPAEP
jgi:nitrite reductase/ring-hydroxylating ferredoxin subunit